MEPNVQLYCLVLFLRDLNLPLMINDNKHRSCTRALTSSKLTIRLKSTE